MKTIVSALLISLGLFAVSSYAMDDMPMPSSKKEVAKVITGKGVVVSLNKASGSVTLKHEAIAAIDWPAMTMNFKVKDKRQLEKLNKGDKVEFTLIPSGNDYLIDSIK